GFVASGTEATFTVPSDQALSSGQWSWRAKAIDSKGAESGWSETRTFTVPNQAPSTPTLISPEEGAVVSSTPTFKLKSEDPDGDNVKFEIEVTKGNERKTFTTGFVASGTEATFTVPSDQALSSGQWSWRAKAIDSKGAESGWSERKSFLVSSATIQICGLRTLGLAIRTGAVTPSEIGLQGVRIAVWDAENQRYRFDAEVTQLQVGLGYWVKADNPVTLRVTTGEEVTIPFPIPLKRGWNFISSPFMHLLTWSLETIKVRRGNQQLSLLAAQQAGWIEDYAWGWQQDENAPFKGKYVLIYDTSIIPSVQGQLEPWKGYWVYAHQDCELILPPPSTAKGRGTKDAGRVARSNGWTVKLVAKVGDENGEAILGVSQGSRGLAVGLPPQPPEGRSDVQVILLKNSAPLAVDVRNSNARQQVWDVLVKFGTRERGRGTRQKEVTLTWDEVSYVPKDVSLILVDLATGTRRYMRTQTTYRFVPNEGETERRFKVIAELSNEKSLRIFGLRATPTRGQGVLIEFGLTKPAQVQAEVLTLTGRRVAVLEVPRSTDSPIHRLIWRGVNGDGMKVSTGVYLVRVQAVDDEGRQIQAVTTVRMRP
ncbi:MAG: hypothetical protein QXO00_07100, partial [Candidatus Bathyarchaeia archaeon]